MNQSSVASRQSPVGENTLADSGFYWRDRGGVKVLVCRELETRGFANGFSTRLGGVSPFPAGDLNLAGFNEDSAENIHENRRRFLSAFAGDPKLALSWQVHGDAIRMVSTEADIGDSDERADALVSNVDDVLIGVKTADCVPVLAGDPIRRTFAAVHAGWRGTAQSIVAKTVARMKQIYGSLPGDLVCAIGPAACSGNYEIGTEVMKAFEAGFRGSEKYFRPTRPGHALVDLHLANKDQLLEAGVRVENIFTAPFCTMERPDLFFSYRLEKQKYGKTGRLMSVIGLQ